MNNSTKNKIINCIIGLVLLIVISIFILGILNLIAPPIDENCLNCNPDMNYYFKDKFNIGFLLIIIIFPIILFIIVMYINKKYGLDDKSRLNTLKKEIKC